MLVLFLVIVLSFRQKGEKSMSSSLSDSNDGSVHGYTMATATTAATTNANTSNDQQGNAYNLTTLLGDDLFDSAKVESTGFAQGQIETYDDFDPSYTAQEVTQSQVNLLESALQRTYGATVITERCV